MPLAEFTAAFPDLCRRLLVSRRADRVGQAYLFVGDSPALLRRFVTAWAQVRACLTPRPDGDACGTCELCVRLANNTYPERVDLVPESKTRQILVDAMRTFDHRLNLSTDAAHPKIGVIAEADCMGNEAQNAFLNRAGRAEVEHKNFALLADAMDPAHPLLDAHGISRQVEVDQCVGELQVAALAARL